MITAHMIAGADARTCQGHIRDGAQVLAKLPSGVGKCEAIEEAKTWLDAAWEAVESLQQEQKQ